MFSILEQNESFREWNEQSRGSLAKLLDMCVLRSASQSLPPNEPWPIPTRSFVVVDSGFLHYKRGGQTLYFLEPGDAVGLIAEVPDEDAIVAAAPTLVREYDRIEFFKQVSVSYSETSAEWSTYVDRQFKLMNQFITQLSARATSVEPSIRYYAPGDPIIIQDTVPEEVFLMLSGSAEVFVGEIRVGLIQSGELFGAMAATMKSRRSASVIAKEDCVVSVLAKENFLSLIDTHPATVHKLVENMARIILLQNERIVELTH